MTLIEILTAISLFCGPHAYDKDRACSKKVWSCIDNIAGPRVRRAVRMGKTFPSAEEEADIEYEKCFR